MYKQEKGNGYATLIRNDLSLDDQTNNKFRMVLNFIHLSLL